jgi:hypothetical protein
MFDLRALDQAETALRALTSGEHPFLAQPTERPAAPRPQGDIAKCPFHNGTLQRAAEYDA